MTFGSSIRCQLFEGFTVYSTSGLENAEVVRETSNSDALCPYSLMKGFQYGLNDPVQQSFLALLFCRIHGFIKSRYSSSETAPVMLSLD